jgi:hypothetical protein
MEDKIDEQLNNLSVTEVPIGMHHSVMREIHSRRLRPALIVSFILLAFNFLIIAWRINAKLIDAEFIDMAQDFLDVFSFNFSYISTMWGSFFEIISPVFFLSAVLSLMGAIYIGKEISFHQFRKI